MAALVITVLVLLHHPSWKQFFPFPHPTAEAEPTQATTMILTASAPSRGAEQGRAGQSQNAILFECDIAKLKKESYSFMISVMGDNPLCRKDCVMKKQSVVEGKKRERGKEDPEINAMFDAVKRRRKVEKSPEEISLFVEKVLAELTIVAEDDAQLNREDQPAINKLKKLPFLAEVLSKKSFQLQFLDHGVLTLLKNWLEPLPDGSLPNANIRGAVLNILADFPIDLEQHYQLEQFKKSGLGRAIMFLSKYDEETVSNRRVAKDLIDRWSRSIFNKSTRFSDLRNDDIHVPVMKKPVSKPAMMEVKACDLDVSVAKEQKLSSRLSSLRQHVTRPEPASLVYTVRPQSKYNPEIARSFARQQRVQGDSRQRIEQRLEQLKASRKKPLQAAKLSAEGRRVLLSV
ncbi:Transcription elongation factor family protein [Theobroma cacao]|uniref:Transcription elongation factor family protein n=1 Tax=Theobroma cacao TaxID=3641 RepID=A0A061F3N7_THECC|nr:Transcription elongation factor family protein [Theobroma cacao]